MISPQRHQEHRDVFFSFAGTEFAKESGASRIDLLTAFDNKAGQHLYEKLGYKKVIEDFYSYSFKV